MRAVNDPAKGARRAGDGGAVGETQVNHDRPQVTRTMCGGGEGGDSNGIIRLLLLLRPLVHFAHMT